MGYMYIGMIGKAFFHTYSDKYAQKYLKKGFMIIHYNNNAVVTMSHSVSLSRYIKARKDWKRDREKFINYHTHNTPCTCETCPSSRNGHCSFAWDFYNTDEDCLAVK